MISYEKLLDKLAAKGITSYTLRKMESPPIAQATLTRVKNGTGGIDHNTLDRLCAFFECQPGDLMEYVPANNNH